MHAYSTYMKRANIKNGNEKKKRIERDSLDQNPPEAAKAGAVRHFARVRYSHFLSDRARAPLLPESLPSSSSLVAVSTDDLVPRTVGVSGGDAAHSRTCGRTADIISDRSDLFVNLFEDIPGDRHRESVWSLVMGLPSGSSCNTRMNETSWPDGLTVYWLSSTGRAARPTENGARLCATSTWRTRDVNVTCGTLISSRTRLKQVFKLELSLN